MLCLACLSYTPPPLTLEHPLSLNGDPNDTVVIIFQYFAAIVAHGNARGNFMMEDDFPKCNPTSKSKKMAGACICVAFAYVIVW